MDAAQKRKDFRYLRDPLFLMAAGAYTLNRFYLKPTFGISNNFIRNHFDDCLFIPAALPVLLWIFRKLHLRDQDEVPTPGEVAQWTFLWAVLFEGIFPYFFHKGTADWWDVLCYVLGGGVSLAIWSGGRAGWRAD